jgi:protein-tyrosine phosphatase
VRLKGSLARQCATLLLAGLSVTIPASAQTSQTDIARIVRADLSHIRIDNFGRINANYFRGAHPQGHDYADLAALGIRSVINLTSDDAALDEKAMVERAGMKYFQIPMTTHEPPTTAQLAEFLKIVNDSVAQPVFVHCVGGRHRTGVMTAVYRMTADAWSADKAFAEMKRYKYGADFLHPEFKRFVYSYRADAAAAAPAQVAGETTKAGR